MDNLATAFPDLTNSIVRALVADGHSDVAQKLPAALIAQVTFDDGADAGYVYVHPMGTPHGETLALESSPFTIVDIDISGNVQGIELLSPPEPLKRELRRRAAI